MDQSTQVNFPIVNRNALNQNRKMKRFNTSGDFFQSHNKSLPVINTVQMGVVRQPLPRPKSLNAHLENVINNNTRNRPKMYFSVDHSPDVSFVSPSSVLKEKTTPTYSCDSSIVSTPKQNIYSNNKFVQHKVRHRLSDEESCGSSSRCYCKCYDYKNENEVTNTKRGLSWRRLHMSRAKLKATSTTSELLSGFAMVAMVELQVNDPTTVPEWLFVMFAVCTTILVSVHIFALMISTYILPNIDAIAKLEVCEMVTESPHERMRGFIELAWAFSTVLGLFLFLVEVAILCWVKFWDYSFPAAIAATVIVIPVLVAFVFFAVHFYHSLVVYKCDSSLDDMVKLEDMKKQLDEIVTSPV